MMRTESQIFFNHLPGQLQRDTEVKIISQIPHDQRSVVSSREVTAYDDKIFDRAEEYLRRYKVLHPGQAFRNEDYELRRVDSVRQRLFPTIFTCRQCKRAVAQGEKQFKAHPENAGFLATCFPCKKAGRPYGNLVQESLVIIHECGLLAQPTIVACKNIVCQQDGRGYRNLEIRKGSSQQVKDMAWWCQRCDEKTGDFFVPHREHPSCEYDFIEMPDGSKRASRAIARPYQDPGVYRRIGFSLVNHSMDAVHGLRRTPGLARTLYEIHLGVKDSTALRKSSNSGADQVREVVENALEAFFGKTLADLPALTQAKGSEFQMLENFCAKQGISLSQLEANRLQGLQDLGLEDRLLESVQLRDSLLDFYQLSDPHYSTMTWRDWLGEANDIPTFDLPVLDYAGQLLHHLHIEDAIYTPRLPIAHVALGYERGRFTAPKAFNLFPKLEDSKRFPLYIHSLETEAIVFQLDAFSVAKWLCDRGHPLPTPKNVSDGRRILLNSLDHESMAARHFGNIVDPASRDVYALLHTMSHCLLKTINAHSSDDAANMGELLFPSVPAVVIYLNKRTRFTSGGIQYLYQRNLAAWLQDAMEQARLCMNDPSCRFGGSEATCYGCTQGSEIGCASFNQLLDRKLLWDFSETGEGAGFWKSHV